VSFNSIGRAISRSVIMVVQCVICKTKLNFDFTSLNMMHLKVYVKLHRSSFKVDELEIEKKNVYVMPLFPNC